jgi:hypothetical protein
MKAKWLSVCVLVLLMTVARTVESQTLLTQTTWGAGADVAYGVVTAADGSSYVVGITDSFTTNQFGTPSPRIFLVKFAPNGTVGRTRRDDLRHRDDHHVRRRRMEARRSAETPMRRS